ncbi:MAG: DUF1365 domain-containing protein [Alphaproteobacteria bacterium]|nr:DUF1365 domain-containing protein [Alphaproteobacteria bacterium]
MTKVASLPGATLYRGKVMHKRMKPFIHDLTYSVFSILVDIDALPEMDRDFRLFGHNRWAPISLWNKDYGPRDGSPIRPWIESALMEHDLDLQGGPIRLLTFPRLWGYAFNPLSLYYCYDSDSVLRAVLYEVSNTFGESHGYLIPVDPDQATGPAIHQETAKVFHVSPFIEMDCQYRFSLTPLGEQVSILINQSDSAGDPILVARHMARGVPLTDKSLMGAILRFPLMTAKVIGGIHWEALKLWMKGAKYYPKPPAPTKHVTR